MAMSQTLKNHATADFFITVHFLFRFPNSHATLLLGRKHMIVGNWSHVCVLRSFVPGSICCFFFNTKSLIDPFLVLRIIASPICIDQFSVILTVLSLVIPDVFFVLLTICSVLPVDLFTLVFKRRALMISAFSMCHRCCGARIRSLFSALYHL